MRVRDAIPSSWTDRLRSGPIGLGLDLATTTKGTSNPSSLAVVEDSGGLMPVRLVVAFKTDDPEVTRAVVSCVLDDLAAAGARPRKLCIDASNETFFASQLRRELRSRVAVDLIKSGAKVVWRGEELSYKTLLGNLLVNALDAGEMPLPAGEWLAADFRLVKREGGGFQADTGKGGQHGDCFDACKLARWALLGTGPIRAEAAAVGSLAGGRPSRPGVVGNLLQRFGRGARPKNCF